MVIACELTSLLLCETSIWIAITVFINHTQYEESKPESYIVIYYIAYGLILWPAMNTLIHLMFIYYLIRGVSAIAFHIFNINLHTNYESV